MAIINGIDVSGVSAQRTWEKLIDAVVEMNVSRRALNVRVRFERGGGVLLGQVGYTVGRWVKYCDQYLEGGPSFDEFLSEDGVGRMWGFGNHAGHHDGACLTWLRVDSDAVRVESRELLVAPTGALDFKMLGIVSDRLGLPVEWKIGVLKAGKLDMISIAHMVREMDQDLPWVQVFWRRYNTNKETKFHRLRRMYKPPRVQDESAIRGGFTFAMRRDLNIAGVSRKVDRGRKVWGVGEINGVDVAGLATERARVNSRVDRPTGKNGRIIVDTGITTS